MGFLIDSCIWIDVERGTISPADVAIFTKKEPVFISPIIIAELNFGAEMATQEVVRQKRLAALDQLINKPSVNIDVHTGAIFGRLAASLRKEGLDHKYRVQDLWLSSQAIQYGLKFLTKNKKDFQDIPGLDLVIFK